MTEIQELAPDQARRLTDRIKVAIEGTWQLIQEAYLTQAWAALGYATWDEYCTREFGTSRLRLPREERQEVVGSLRDAGLTVRAIAAATGLSRGTIGNQVSKIGHLRSEPVTGIDGKSYSPTQPPRPGRAPSDADLLSGRDWAPADTRQSPVTEPAGTGATVSRIGQHLKPAPEPTLDPHAELDALCEEGLAQALEQTGIAFRANFSAAMARADDVWQFDVQRIAEVFSAPEDRRAIAFWLTEMGRWCDRVNEALDKTVQLRPAGGNR